MQGHVKWRTTFTEGTTSYTTNIRYLVVNVPSAYNILLGRPALNMIGAVASSRHMKMKFPSLEGAMITMKSDQKEAKRCFENNLETKRGVCAITIQPPREERVTRIEIAREKRLEPAEEVLEREIDGKKFKHGTWMLLHGQPQTCLVPTLISCVITSPWTHRSDLSARGGESSMMIGVRSSEKRPKSC